jgi:putative ABC transport system permease protein
MTRIALRYLWARRLRTLLTSLAIVLGVMMITGTYVLTDTIDRSFEDIFTQSNEGVDAIITSKEAIDSVDGSEQPLPDRLLRDVRDTDGVEYAEGGISDPDVSIIGPDGEPVGGNGAPTFAFGAPSDRFDPLSYEGRRPEANDEVAIDRLAAESEGYEVGDSVPVAGKEAAREYELVGLASLGGIDSFGGASIAVLTFEEARRITGKENVVDTITVAAEEGTSPDVLVRNLEAVLPSDVQAETGAENVESQREEIAEFLGYLETALLIFAGVALLVAAFLIFNTFSITVAQRTREFGMLRAMGAKRRQIVGSVALEALVIGLIASAAGFGLGVAFAGLLESVFRSLEIDLPASGTVIKAGTVVAAAIVGVGTTVVAALVPALRATRVPPVAALREGAVLETPRQSRRREAAGLVLGVAGIAGVVLGLADAIPEAWMAAGAAAVFIGVALLSPRLVRPLASLVGTPLERLRGMPGRLARENAVRNPTRTAATAAALMIGLAVVSFVAVFAAGLRASIDNAIDKVFSSDLILAHTDGFSDIPARAGDAVAGVEGVDVVSAYRFTESRVAEEGDEGLLSLVDPATVNEVLEFEWTDGSPETLSRLGPEGAAIDEKWGKENGLAVGDTFEATTPTGEKITYEVRGTFTDNADFAGNYIASDENAAAYGLENTVSQYLVSLEEGADVAEVRGVIDDGLGADFPTVEVQDQEELKDSLGEELNALLGAVFGLLALAVIVSLFGIVNTLALTIYERTRELGLLRAVGMSRRQIRRMVRYEAVITALIGAVLGAVLGVVFAAIASQPLADEGFELEIPWLTLAILLVLAAIAGVIAAIGPARRASRLDVLDALAYE